DATARACPHGGQHAAGGDLPPGCAERAGAVDGIRGGTRALRAARGAGVEHRRAPEPALTDGGRSLPDRAGAARPGAGADRPRDPGRGGRLVMTFLRGSFVLLLTAALLPAAACAQDAGSASDASQEGGYDDAIRIGRAAVEANPD